MAILNKIMKEKSMIRNLLLLVFITNFAFMQDECSEITNPEETEAQTIIDCLALETSL